MGERAGNGRVALVTGSTAGIGRAIAIALGADGYAVVLNGRRDAVDAEEARAAVQRAGGAAGSCVYVRADVAEAAGREALREAVRSGFGRLDVLVNNAGVTTEGRRDMLELSEEAMLRVLKTNLVGPFLLSSALAGLMENGDALRYIVNISSISAYQPSVNRADYCISKAGMGMMTKLFALRLASHGVRVFEIRPGIIRTDMTGPVAAKYDAKIGGGLLPLSRWGEPEDVARAVLAVVRGHHDYATGEVINVDGGFHINRGAL
ncbi:MAG: 3-ketoacyl-ACP reductase [Spirochaetes bacterium]|jgi:NAD(P)-dependent dehydrogenase (short-subunit alcohol dehydrogenase family)|nr:3-ketoacyl-ACP reductase [Spirochaetota bacterium]